MCSSQSNTLLSFSFFFHEQYFQLCLGIVLGPGNMESKMGHILWQNSSEIP